MPKSDEKHANFPYGDPDDSTFPYNVVSSTECTGLIPTPPLSDDESDAYSDLYDIPPTE
ncbi:MAG: hypothetical protein ACOYI4_07585 [Christensenellales bacterium]